MVYYLLIDVLKNAQKLISTLIIAQIVFIKRVKRKLGMVVPAWNSSTLEAETGDCCEFEAILGYILKSHFGARGGVRETETACV